MVEQVKDKDADKAKTKDSSLDEALKGTFPASDPVAPSQPGGEERKPEDPKR